MTVDATTATGMTVAIGAIEAIEATAVAMMSVVMMTGVTMTATMCVARHAHGNAWSFARDSFFIT